MNRLMTFLCLWLVGTLAVVSAEGLPATVVLKRKQIMTVEVQRRQGSIIYVREPGKTAEIGLNVSELADVQFTGLVIKDQAVLEQYARGEFSKVAAVLKPAAMAVLPYLDLPGNAAAGALRLLRCLYWDNKFDEAAELGLKLMYQSNAAVRDEARLYRELARLGQGQLKLVEQSVAELGKGPGVQDDLGPLFYYLRTKLALARKEWKKAQQTAAQAIVFNSKNVVWLPPLLLVSAEAYAGGGSPAIAARIAREAQDLAPDSHWARLAETARKQWVANDFDTGEDEAAVAEPPKTSVEESSEPRK